MSLQKQTITLDFGFGGIDESVDPKRLMPVKFSELKNVRFNKTGRIDRRYGTSAIAFATSTNRVIAADSGLFASYAPSWPSNEGYPNKVVRLLSNGSMEQLASTDDNSMVAAEITANVIGQSRKLAGSATVLRYDVAYGTTYYASAVEYLNSSNTPTVLVELRERNSHQLYKSFAALTGASAPKLIADPSGGNAFVMQSFSGSLTVQYHVFSDTVSTMFGTLISSGVSSASIGRGVASCVAVCNTSHSQASSIIWTAYTMPAGLTIVLGCCTFPDSNNGGMTVIGSSTAIGSSVTIQAVTLSQHRNPYTQSTTVRLSWYEHLAGAGVKSGVYSTTCSQVLAPVVVDSSTAVSVFQIVGANSSSTNYIGVSIGQGTVTATTYVYGINALNTAFSVVAISGFDIASNWQCSYDTQDMVYGWWAYRSDTTQSCALLFSLSQNSPYRKVSAMGRIFYGDGPSPISTTEFINGTPSMYNAGGNTWKTPLLRKQRVSYSGDPAGGTYDIYEVTHVSVSTATGWHNTPIRNEQLLTGGFPTLISRAEGPVPVAPLLAPKIVSLAATTVGSMTAGSYAVSGIYEFIDTSGRVHRSGPALPSTITLSGTQVGIVATYEAYRVPDGLFSNFAQQSGRLKFVPFRTLANESQVYYRTQSSTACGATLSATSVFAVSLSIADATISTQQPLYTVGGVFPDYMPSAVLAMASNGRRVMAVEADRPNFVLEGKPVTEGFGVSFLEDVGREIQGGGERIYGLASYLDRWFAFKKNGIFIASGDGADVTGKNDTLSEFQPIAAAIGCTEPRSIVTTDSGIVFKASDGFYFLGSVMTPLPIGKSIEDRVGTATVIDACYNQKTSEASFAMSDGALHVLTIWKGDDGSIDFRWATDDNITTSHLAVSNNKRYFFYSGSMYEESTGYVDAQGTTAVPTIRYTTAWAPMGGIQGFGRIYKALFAGNFSSTQASTTVTVQIGYDYSTTYAETHTMDSANFKRNGEAVHFEIRPQRTRCEAIRFDIQESGPASVTAGTHAPGLSMNQIQLEVGIKSGSNKLPSSAMARKA